MTSKPPLSVIIPWCDRPELETTLQANSSGFSAFGCEVLVISCGGDSTSLAQLLKRLDLPSLAGYEVTRDEAEAETFNKSLALNLGAAAARSHQLFLLDADIVLGEAFLEQASQALTEGSFVTVDRVEESQKARTPGDSQLLEIVHSMEFETVGGQRAKVETNRLRFSDGSRSAPGLVLLRREDFIAVGGMSSRLEGWGWEDLDLLVRLQLQLSLAWKRVGSVVHLSHGDEARSFHQDGKAANQRQNLSACLEQYHQGCFLGTYEEDTAALSSSLHRLI
ncbi:MAG: glycosyl transferase family 2 [Deltaproteobacteria bacterium]|nr:glycosyl transferase family 2 [Deltaproteobacteria bacterium]